MSESSPALSEVEWARGRVEKPQPGEPGYVVVTPYIEERDGAICVSAHYSNARVHPELRHPLAALCLHGQPFGFTWEDVDAMEAVYRRVIASPEPFGEQLAAAIERVHDLADRLAALLPPREQ